MKILELLEWLTKYGFIDIIFGLGVVSLLWRILRKYLPSNYPLLHINLSRGPVLKIRGEDIPTTVQINIRNSGLNNFYIARAYFRPKLRPFWLLWLYPMPTQLKGHPASDRISEKDAYELKFQVQNQAQGLTEYEALVKPGHDNGVMTALALTQEASAEMIQNRSCGKIYIEYAVAGQQGIHRVRV